MGRPAWPASSGRDSPGSFARSPPARRPVRWRCAAARPYPVPPPQTAVLSLAAKAVSAGPDFTGYRRIGDRTLRHCRLDSLRLLAQARVERVAQAVAQEVEREDRAGDRQGGEGAQ